MAEPKWKKLVDDLLRLAQDDGATEDERNVARLKLAQVLEKHPDAEQIEQYEPLREFTLGDLRAMKRAGISTDGSWTGRTLEDALYLMVSDYGQRLAMYRPKRKSVAFLGPVTPEALGTWMREIDLELAAMNQ